MQMDWRKGGFIISDEAWGAVDENEALGVSESKVSDLQSYYYKNLQV